MNVMQKKIIQKKIKLYCDFSNIQKLLCKSFFCILITIFVYFELMLNINDLCFQKLLNRIFILHVYKITLTSFDILHLSCKTFHQLRQIYSLNGIYIIQGYIK